MDFEQKYLHMVREKLIALSEGIDGEIFLFGSRSRHDGRRDSDLDVGFDKMDRETFRQIERAFFAYLEESIIPWDVDLVYFPNVDKGFKAVAEKEKVIWKHA